jgi:general secretion pathway protein E
VEAMPSNGIVVEANSVPAFLAWLVEAGRITGVLAERVTRVQAETSDRLASIFLKLGLLSESALADDLAEYAHLGRLSPGSMPAKPVAEGILNPEFLRLREVLPIALTSDSIEIACWDALDEYARRAIQFAVGLPVTRRVATREEIHKALEALYPRVARTPAGDLVSAEFEDEEVDRLKDLASDAPVIRLVQRLIDEACGAHASDIHLEPSEDALHVRLRMDGLLRETERHPRKLAGAVISRIKVMAGLDIAERRLPQDGRIRVSVRGKEIDFRVATSPTLHGESAVLRVLDRQDVALDFEALGFDAQLTSVLREAIAQPHGIVLVTGPTGSGKTTTLYAALKEINTADRKILTVEDPVEYTLPGVNQVPVRPNIGLTFAHALRAFLRQDPDVLMVGEIRDRETAEIAVQAALTGHLLFSTLHTNTAAGAATRLLDMGIADYLLTSTLHVVFGQRLLRRLCLDCRESYVPAPDVCTRFRFETAGVPVWYRAKGCPACQGTGYRGRTAILEALRMSDAVRAAILGRADAHAIEKLAVSEGMRTLFRHGLDRVTEGTTSLEEVLRVTSMS